ncbi:MAG: branched-chain amino acid ABC transporter permease [Betaproteobacteria bacterium]|nr:branched-chain amino acid ABC transporter permease [Betaproteobacteria bacterium]
MSTPTPTAVSALARRHRWRIGDIVPWVIALAAFFLFPKYLQLGMQVLIMLLFTLSIDLLLGYAGVITLGHAAFFGIGAYCAGILSVRAGLHDPLLGLVAAGLLAGAAGLACGALILRTRGLTLLMLTLGILLLLSEVANRAAWLTGGADGLQGMTVGKLIGVFDWDVLGRTGYLYCLVITFAGFVLVRTLVMSPFGRSLVGMRENAVRMEAVGAPVRSRLTAVYGISALIAGVAGALNAQTNQFVALNVLSFELSGAVLIMLILGGTGRLYGAFIGAPVYMIAADWFARLDPTYWLFWLGAMLVALVMFARGGVLGLCDRLARRRVSFKAAGK